METSPVVVTVKSRYGRDRSNEDISPAAKDRFTLQTQSMMNKTGEAFAKGVLEKSIQIENNDYEKDGDHRRLVSNAASTEKFVGEQSQVMRAHSPHNMSENSSPLKSTL